MYAEYERRERRRKVDELRELCGPDRLGEEEAEVALELCDNRWVGGCAGGQGREGDGQAGSQAEHCTQLVVSQQLRTTWGV